MRDEFRQDRRCSAELFHNHLNIGLHRILHRIAGHSASLLYGRTQQSDQRPDVTFRTDSLNRGGNRATMLMPQNHQQRDVQMFGAIFQATEFDI